MFLAIAVSKNMDFFVCVFAVLCIFNPLIPMIVYVLKIAYFRESDFTLENFSGKFFFI